MVMHELWFFFLQCFTKKMISRTCALSFVEFLLGDFANAFVSFRMPWKRIVLSLFAQGLHDGQGAGGLDPISGRWGPPP